LVIQYLTAFKDYFIEVLPYLAIGFLVSGVIHEFVPSKWVERHLGGGGVKPILYSTLIGTILPICCLGSLPVAVSLHQKGARLGPVLAFLVATPATSITALLVTYGLLGLKFTIFIFFAVIAMGLVMGLVGNMVKGRAKVLAPPAQQALDPVCGMNVEVGKAAKTEYGGETYYFCCSHCQQAFESKPEEYIGTYSRNVAHRVKHVFRYAFVDMVKEIGPGVASGSGPGGFGNSGGSGGRVRWRSSRWGIGVSLQPWLWLNHVYLLHSQRSPGPRLCVAGNEYRRRNGAPVGGAHYQLGHYPGSEKGIRWQDSGYLSGGRQRNVFGFRILLFADIARW